ncbi:hypothetical protein OIO90_005393 [Microbotryomycetes sp. JL221]|nr:hypothetical protein OIO90_005393 [Microbotryomycetes sp. JL221]
MTSSGDRARQALQPVSTNHSTWTDSTGITAVMQPDTMQSDAPDNNASLFGSVVSSLWRSLKLGHKSTSNGGTNATMTTNKRARTATSTTHYTTHQQDSQFDDDTDDEGDGQHGKRRKLDNPLGHNGVSMASILPPSLSAPNLRAHAISGSTSLGRLDIWQHDHHSTSPQQSHTQVKPSTSCTNLTQHSDNTVLDTSATNIFKTWSIARQAQSHRQQPAIESHTQEPTDNAKRESRDANEGRVESAAVTKIRRLEDEIQRLQRELSEAKRVSDHERPFAIAAGPSATTRGPPPPAPPPPPPPAPPPPPPVGGRSGVPRVCMKPQAVTGPTGFLAEARASLKATPPRPKRKLPSAANSAHKGLDMSAFLDEMKGIKLKKVERQTSTKSVMALGSQRPVHELQNVLQQAFNRKFAKARAFDISSPMPSSRSNAGAGNPVPSSPSWDSPRPAPPVPRVVVSSVNKASSSTQHEPIPSSSTTINAKELTTTPRKSAVVHSPKMMNTTTTTSTERLDQARGQRSNPTPPREAINYSRPLTPGRQKKLAEKAAVAAAALKDKEEEEEGKEDPEKENATERTVESMYQDGLDFSGLIDFEAGENKNRVASFSSDNDMRLSSTSWLDDKRSSIRGSAFSDYSSVSRLAADELKQQDTTRCQEVANNNFVAPLGHVRKRRLARRLPLSSVSINTFGSGSGASLDQAWMKGPSSGENQKLQSRFSEATVDFENASQSAIDYDDLTCVRDSLVDTAVSNKSKKRKAGEWDAWDLMRAEEGLM